MFIGEIFEAATPKRPGIEAHGIRGFKNTPWRKIFKSTEAMLAWAEKYDAEILGTRDLESASQGRLAPAISEDATELSVGDPVIITGDVQFNGATGEIDSFGQNNAFVVVNLYNHGRHSFHSSDVDFNDYADSDEEEARMYDDGEFQDEFEEGIGDTIKRGVKQVKRGMQGWGNQGMKNMTDKETPRDLVNRNKGYDDEKVKSLSKFRKAVDQQRPAPAHSPQALQNRVLDREMKKRGLGEESATLYDETETNELAGLDRDPGPEAIARNKRLGDIWRRTAGMTPAEYAATVQTDGRTAAALRAQADADEPGNIASQARTAEYKKKFQRVGEAKSLSKQVRVVKGPNAGATGWIREIKTGAFKGAPKTYFVDLDNGKQANNLPASALRLIKSPVTEFKDASALKPGLLVNHPLTGNCRIVSIAGDQVKVSAIKGGKVYTVQRSSLKLGPMKMDERDAGISKDAETKFHTKLDKLVHSTFGKRQDEMAEDSGDDNEAPTQFFVAMYDGNENTAFVGQLLKRGGQWHERKVAGTAPYSWGSKTYQSYLSVREIMSWIDRDYGDEGNEVKGPFATAQEAREYAEHQYVPLGEAEGTPEGLPSITPAMAQNILNQIETEGPSAISKSIEWGDGAAAEMIAMFKADLKKVAAGEKVIDEACWKNYRQIGMKKKNGKQVPNCVPESNYAGRKDVPGFMSGQ